MCFLFYGALPAGRRMTCEFELASFHDINAKSNHAETDQQNRQRVSQKEKETVMQSKRKREDVTRKEKQALRLNTCVFFFNNNKRKLHRPDTHGL